MHTAISFWNTYYCSSLFHFPNSKHNYVWWRHLNAEILHWELFTFSIRSMFLQPLQVIFSPSLLLQPPPPELLRFPQLIFFSQHSSLSQLVRLLLPPLPRSSTPSPNPIPTTYQPTHRRNSDLLRIERVLTDTSQRQHASY